MELALETRSPSEARADVLVVGQYGEGARPAPEITALERALGGLLSRVLKTSSQFWMNLQTNCDLYDAQKHLEHAA